MRSTKRIDSCYLLKHGCAAALMVLLLIFGSCSEKVPTVVPAESVFPSASVSVAPAKTPVPTVTPVQIPAYTYKGQAVSLASDYVNIRQEPRIGAKIKGEFPAGATADVIEYSYGWARIVYNNTEGYVSRDYIFEILFPEVAVPVGDWASVVINQKNLLPEGFEVSLADFEGGQVDARILEVCEKMFADAKKAGVDLRLMDAYRSYKTQSEQYEKKVKSIMAKKRLSRSKAEKEAAKITARPNTSEHQTGLALDIVTSSYKKRDAGFAKTKAFKWLNENAHNYGFTLRYKKNKVSVTKVIYEPWHWRFVGVKAAADMKISGQCLEEYFGS